MFGGLKKQEEPAKEEESDPNIPQLKNMKRTQSYLTTRAGPMELVSAIFEMLISNANVIACILMVLAQILNGQLLTMVYPIAVFGYVLLEETRPARWFWDAIILYSLAFIFVRFAAQFNFGADGVLEVMRDYYIGIEPMKDGVQMIQYILVEVCIVGAATIAKLNEDLIGLGEEDELDRESISDAIKRFLENSTIKARL